MEQLQVPTAMSSSNRLSRATLLILAVIFFANFAYADSACSTDGFTVIFVNGILTTKQQAEDSKNLLFSYVPSKLKNETTDIELGYNQTHFQGYGDKFESLAQAFNSSISDFDLDTILMQMHDEVHTQKLLLVGHSQGTFYTNEIYQYLVTHGVSPESVAVYNIATPASSVAGGGRYVTSTNDKAINWIRDTEVSGNVGAYVNSYYTYKGSLIESPLRGNITIAKETGWEGDDFGGHHFDVYMNGAGDRIVSDIDAALSKLKPSGNGEDCFAAPQPDIKYKMQAAAFTVADPLVNAAGAVVDPIVGTAWSSTKTALSAIGSVMESGSSDLSNAAIGAFLSNSLDSALSEIMSTRGAFADISANDSQTAAAAAASSEPQASPETAASPDVQPKVVSTKAPSPTIAKSTEAPAAPSVKTATVVTSPTAQTQTPAPSNSPVPTLFSVAPGFGGGGGTSNSEISAPAAPNVPTVTFSISSPVDNAYFGTTSVNFSGTADAGAAISLIEGAEIASTTADASGAWSLSQIFSEGMHALNFLAALTGASDTTVSRSLTVDTQAPATTTLSIAACAQSIASGFCALPTASVDAAWTAVADASAYGIAVNGTVVSSTTALFASVPLTDNATNTVAVVSYDAAGNTATSSSIDVYAISRPLIINEIGWAGDGIDASHQWIELKNLAPFALDLTHIEIARSAGVPITPTSILPSGRAPYLTIARSELLNSASVPVLVSQKEIIPFDLLATSTAEQLSILWNGTTVDATPAQASCTGWCRGGFSQKLGSNVSGRADLLSGLSMERIADSADGADPASWQTTDSYGPYLGHSNTASLWGTPDDANSTALPDAGIYCGTASNLLQPDQPFNMGNRICTYLSKFITGGSSGANRDILLFRGTIGSSTNPYGLIANKSLAVTQTLTMPADSIAGEPFFFAIFEERTFGSDLTDFENYFEQSASTTLGYNAPHGNYVTLPFTYQP